MEGGMLAAHAGTADGFVPLVPGRRYLTRMPVLLLCCSVPGGRPRYAALSTLSLRVEAASFGHTAASTLRDIARYVDTCRTHGVAAFTLDGRSSRGADGTGADCTRQAHGSS